MGYVGAMGQHYHQKATYWPGTSDDGYGNATWGAPVAIDCRWEDMTEEKLTSSGPAGETVLSRSVVYTPQALAEGNYVFLGETAETNPTALKGAFVIRRVSVIPSLRADHFENAAYL